MISIAPYPSLDLCIFKTTFPQKLESLSTPREILEQISTSFDAPMHSDDEVRLQIRNLLRQCGFKPTGRNKPASEYLIKAVENHSLASINLAVDTLNVVSLHSGLPISVVDHDLLQSPLSIQVAEADASYTFNRSGQSIDIAGLVCLFDASGPCANAVKDSQRTKTSPDTRITLNIIWGSQALNDRTEVAFKWYRELLMQCGARVDIMEMHQESQ